MSLTLITAFTLTAALVNGMAVAVIAQLWSAEPRPVPVRVAAPSRAQQLYNQVFSTIANPPVRRTAPVRAEAPPMCWGEQGVSCELQAAALLDQLGQARREGVVGERLVA